MWAGVGSVVSVVIPIVVVPVIVVVVPVVIPVIVDAVEEVPGDGDAERADSGVDLASEVVGDVDVVEEAVVVDDALLSRGGSGGGLCCSRTGTEAGGQTEGRRDNCQEGQSPCLLCHASTIDGVNEVTMNRS